MHNAFSYEVDVVLLIATLNIFIWQPDDGPAIPKFGEWDDSDPRSGESYTEVFNKVRADKHAAGGKSPIITTENAYYYGQRSENPKVCSFLSLCRSILH